MSLDEGRILAREKYVELLRQNHLDSFANVVGFSGGTVLKRLKLRSLVRFPLSHGGAETEFFLKRHQPVPLWEKLKNWLRLSRPVSPGRQEWENIQALENLGIRSLPVVAFGEEKQAGASFLLSERITDAELAHLFVGERFASAATPELLAARRLFIRRLAELSRRFHQAGYDHRDFYLSHFFVKEAAGDFQLRLIDLQRVGRRSHFRRRRLVKDLAALNYSAPDCITARDKLRFYKCYRDIEKLTAKDRRFIRSILRKTERIRAHDLKSKRRKQKGRGSTQA